VGATLDAAWIRMESLEQGARIIWTARTLGQVNELGPEAVARLRRERDV
jgi:ribulose-5-phosphate 4-epimerase/fuculose-1-phosphate aldolase